jgi:hypothetical protein
MLDDALTLHPNYIALLGWQGADARDFIKEQPEWVARGLREMGYRILPPAISFPDVVRAGTPFVVTSEWINRGVGRTPNNLRLYLTLSDLAENRVTSIDAGELATTQWMKGTTFRCQHSVQWGKSVAWRIHRQHADQGSSHVAGHPDAAARV